MHSKQFFKQAYMVENCKFAGIPLLLKYFGLTENKQPSLRRA